MSNIEVGEYVRFQTGKTTNYTMNLCGRSNGKAYRNQLDIQNFIKENFVSKDKIREKIKEYDGLKESDMQAYEEQIRPLKELLEEE